MDSAGTMDLLIELSLISVSLKALWQIQDLEALRVDAEMWKKPATRWIFSLLKETATQTLCYNQGRLCRSIILCVLCFDLEMSSMLIGMSNGSNMISMPRLVWYEVDHLHYRPCPLYSARHQTGYVRKKMLEKKLEIPVLN